MKNKFKAGGLVFELTGRGRILLSKLSLTLTTADWVSTDLASYTSQGINEQLKVSRLFHATPENRQALVTLYGEDAVPELPLRGSELTKKLLKKQGYVLCWTAAQSDDIARKYKELDVIEFMDDMEEWFVCVNGHGYNHAVPVDMNGNEITEIEK